MAPGILFFCAISPLLVGFAASGLCSDFGTVIVMGIFVDHLSESVGSVMKTEDTPELSASTHMNRSIFGEVAFLYVNTFTHEWILLFYCLGKCGICVEYIKWVVLLSMSSIVNVCSLVDSKKNDDI